MKKQRPTSPHPISQTQENNSLRRQIENEIFKNYKNKFIYVLVKKESTLFI